MLSGYVSSVQTYFDEPWALTYANADRLLDMRDEEMVLRDEEVTGELPEDLEYEEFNEIREQLAAIIEEQLAVYKTRQVPLDLGLVVREYLSQYPRARHFDVARIVIDQAVTSWRSASRFHRTASEMAAD